MLSRRSLLAAAALAPLTALGVTLADRTVLGQAFLAGQRQFHLPLTAETALWHDLVRAEQSGPFGQVRYPDAVAEIFGTEVMLRGFVQPAAFDVVGGARRQFRFLVNPPGCPGCSQTLTGGVIEARAAEAIPTGPEAVTLRGRLHPHEAQGFVLYSLSDARLA